MAKIIPITDHFQHFLGEMKESFWGEVYGETSLPGGSFWGQIRSGSETATRCGRRTRALFNDAVFEPRRLASRPEVEDSILLGGDGNPVTSSRMEVPAL